MSMIGFMFSTPNTPNPRKGTETSIAKSTETVFTISPNTPNPRKGTETLGLLRTLRSVAHSEYP